MNKIKDYRRAVSCVNALAGIENPKAFVEAVLAFRKEIIYVLESLMPDKPVEHEKYILQKAIEAFDRAKGEGK